MQSNRRSVKTIDVLQPTGGDTIAAELSPDPAGPSSPPADDPTPSTSRAGSIAAASSRPRHWSATAGGSPSSAYRIASVSSGTATNRRPHHHSMATPPPPSPLRIWLFRVWHVARQVLGIGQSLRLVYEDATPPEVIEADRRDTLVKVAVFTGVTIAVATAEIMRTLRRN